MSYIGKPPSNAFTSLLKQDFTTSVTTGYTLDHAVNNANDIALFINFVRQEPTAAYSASGTTLTLTSATSATDDMYCVYLGQALQTVNPPNGSVGTAQLIDDAVTKAKTSDLLYPAFEARLSANQSITDLTATKVQFDTEVFDTDSAYDNVTNYRFTPQVAGKYFVYSTVVGRDALTGTFNISQFNLDLRKNGSTLRLIGSYFNALALNFPLFVCGSIDMNGTTDYLEIFASFRSSNSAATAAYADSQTTYFGAYRIGD